MAELSTPRYNIKYGWDLGEDGWKSGMDSNLLSFDAFINTRVLDKDLADPSALAPSAGDMYIVGPTAINDWVGQDHHIAYYTGASWLFYAPKVGAFTLVGDEDDAPYRFNGTVWVATWFFKGVVTFDAAATHNADANFIDSTLNLDGTSTLALADGANITTGSTTGTMIGAAPTQQLSFWGATPVAQPASADQAEVTVVSADGDFNPTIVVPAPILPLTNVDEAIGGLTIGAAYAQAEVEALRDATEVLADDVRDVGDQQDTLRANVEDTRDTCEILADDVRNMHTLLAEIRTALVASGAIKGGA